MDFRTCLRPGRSIAIAASLMFLSEFVVRQAMAIPNPAPTLFQSRPSLVERGGIAGGNPSNNPSGTGDAPTAPPSSTYVSGPTINGSRGGFIGLVIGLAVFVGFVVLGGWYILKRRKTGARNGGGGVRKAAFPSSRSAREPTDLVGGKSWPKQEINSDDEDDAFEMGRSNPGSRNPSSLSLGVPNSSQPWLQSTTSVNLSPDVHPYDQQHMANASGESLNLESARNEDPGRPYDPVRNADGHVQ